MDGSPARQAAYHTLAAVRTGQFLDVAFDKAASGLDERDRRWARECAFGTLRLRGRIDRLVDHHVHRGLSSLEPEVLDLLRLGAYQVLYMAVPDYAAVGQTVDQAKAVSGRGGSGLVNGVLRSVVREGENRSIFPDPATDRAAYLASWHSHPRWLVDRWLAVADDAAVEVLLTENNRVPPVYLRPLGRSTTEATSLLGLDDDAVDSHGICVRLPAGLSTTEALGRVRGIIQDPAAALVTQFVDAPPTAVVADLCAAPGGKAVALAERVRTVVAADRSLQRLERVVENRNRLNSRVIAVAARAQAPPLRTAGVVLVDVPCSGTGTFRRHPDLKWRLRPESIESLVVLQRAILEGAAQVVPPGGLLVYATCTLEHEENEEQVEAFLNRHPEFQIEASAGVDAALVDTSGFLRVDPRSGDTDGAFAARMRRIS